MQLFNEENVDSAPFAAEKSSLLGQLVKQQHRDPLSLRATESLL